MWTDDDRIPNAVAAVVGQAIGALDSHSAMKTLFMESGFPGDPPPGNCVSKSQAWIKRTREDSSRHPFAALGELLGNFSIRRHINESQHAPMWSQIQSTLEKFGLQYDGESMVRRMEGSREPSKGVNIREPNLASPLSDMPPVSLAPGALDTGALAPPAAPLSRERSRDVFMVHGHEHGLKNTVARFIGELGLKPVILHERADDGATIIQKLEDQVEPGFAVVLCTADDNCCALASNLSAELKPRPRQNVVLELGYFLGKLGRSGVCAIVDPNIELPSDFDGVLFAPRSEWQQKLYDRLSSAGYSFDQERTRKALSIR
jgi:hypothetical protein